MNNNTSIRFLVVFLWWFCASSAYSEENRFLSCQSTHGASNYLQAPKRVLLVPLLDADSDAKVSERWAEQPAGIIAAFYRNRFNAVVKQLRNVWSWADFYQQVEQMLQQSPPFDRVIFIGHGGFDGPILKNKVFWQDLMITDGNAKWLQLSESQPGLKNVLLISYNVNKNQVFTDYIATHRLELAALVSSDIWLQLKGLQKQLQPLDKACFNRYCSADKLATSPKEIHEARINICEVVCRKPLFDLKASVEISLERFFLFTKTLRSLVTEDGLIFFGACNPGSAAPKEALEHDSPGLLINSTVLGGPYQTYVHLVSSATDRVTAGPIGSSSADDIVNRIIRFESNNHQHFLCVVAPAFH